MGMGYELEEAYGVVVVVPENTANFTRYGFVRFRTCDERTEKG